MKVKTALQSGRLIKGPCRDCSADPSVTQGHHPDYSKPLEVIWLCSDCHWAEHAKDRPLIYNIRIATLMNAPQVEKLQKLAAKRKCSVGEVVRNLLELAK